MRNFYKKEDVGKIELASQGNIAEWRQVMGKAKESQPELPYKPEHKGQVNIRKSGLISSDFFGGGFV